MFHGISKISRIPRRITANLCPLGDRAGVMGIPMYGRGSQTNRKSEAPESADMIFTLSKLSGRP